MISNFEEKPLYRFFNVIWFVLYAFVVVIAVIAFLLIFDARKVTKATIVCRDGTSWDALKPKNILYNSYAESGLCTKRNPDGTYSESTYRDVDYNSFTEKITKEPLSWSMLIYPLVVFAIGFGLVDFLKLIVIYVFAGRIAFEKSLLLQILVNLFYRSSDTQEKKEDGVDKHFSLLYDVIPKDEIIKIGTIDKEITLALKQAEDALKAFYEKYQRDESFFESNEILDLDTDIIEEYFRLQDQFRDLKLADMKIRHSFERMGVLIKDLKKGMSIEDARIKLDKMLKKHGKVDAKQEVQVELSKALAKEIIASKRLYGKDFKKKTIDMNRIKKRILKEHPEWKS